MATLSPAPPELKRDDAIEHGGRFADLVDRSDYPVNLLVLGLTGFMRPNQRCDAQPRQQRHGFRQRFHDFPPVIVLLRTVHTHAAYAGAIVVTVKPAGKIRL